MISIKIINTYSTIEFIYSAVNTSNKYDVL